MSSIDARNVQHIGFILIPEFALMSYASASEPLRAANLLAGREIYRLSTFSPDGAPAFSSGGVPVPAAPLPGRGSGLATVFVCAGGSPRDWHYPAVLACLRQLAREGVRIGGISGGPYLLAAAGLLTERDFTIHWEHAPALLEAFPALSPRQARFVIDGNRITCGGGIAPLDMMHVLISERMGPDFARRVSDWYLHTEVAEPTAPQRGSLAERYGVHHPGLLSVLEKMEETIELPLDRTAMARIAGVTPRHLDRLFAAHLGSTFLDQYRRIRLQHARRLLEQSPLSISEIAIATGFSSGAHFSRAYRNLYGIAPSETRQA
ncbi:GlxA family transcriptional regulator [Rhizobium sp. BK060]|uniref:GlxA family transcriptional regulator n=1 Tax=Rhizobium sp. BK060 TaxID=2587096 RepID=UPI0016225606|nr:GlxA family transcriptional regulator [Rhizobium sp. BK060]MBB3395340.1 transcriptional regulator GlxA family with amidase domain [Rhizobium sp. BK060]